jgi:hypothetical protein
MIEITKKLVIFFKRKEANLEEDDGDDSSGGEYWKFADLDDVECWSLDFIPMSNWAHFVHKFTDVLAKLTRRKSEESSL